MLFSHSLPQSRLEKISNEVNLLNGMHLKRKKLKISIGRNGFSLYCYFQVKYLPELVSSVSELLRLVVSYYTSPVQIVSDT